MSYGGMFSEGPLPYPEIGGLVMGLPNFSSAAMSQQAVA